MLAEIYNWFTEGFDTGDLKDAKSLLDELIVTRFAGVCGELLILAETISSDLNLKVPQSAILLDPWIIAVDFLLTRFREIELAPYPKLACRLQYGSRRLACLEPCWCACGRCRG